MYNVLLLKQAYSIIDLVYQVFSATSCGHSKEDVLMTDMMYGVVADAQDSFVTSV